ncbi:MAG: glycine-rich domain-containing protein [bacterium]
MPNAWSTFIVLSRSHWRAVASRRRRLDSRSPRAIVGSALVLLSLSILWLAPNADAAYVSATGGNYTNDVSGWRMHVFTNTATAGNFVVTTGGTVEYLIVGGGGGGGGGAMWAPGGGGGAGGVLTGTVTVAATSYGVVVGTGGCYDADTDVGTVGGLSSFNGIEALGGGGGANGVDIAASSGGSGGGGNGYDYLDGAAGTTGQGNDGGDGYPGEGAAGGGGGAGSPGSNAVISALGGNGGNGTSSSISGTPRYYGGGGGGGSYPGGTSSGGLGGGGGGASPSAYASAGGTNTGGGGGGGVTAPYVGTNGGSGIVIIRYQLALPGLTIVNGLPPTGGNLSTTSAVVTASVTTNGGTVATGYLFYGLTNAGTNFAWSFTNELGILPSAGTVTNTITNLSLATTYYFMFYATNTGLESAWGGSTGVAFATLGRPVVTTLAATNILKGSAWLNGNLTSTGGAPTTVRVYWAVNDQGPVFAGWLGTNDFGVVVTGALTARASGLNPGQTYYYRYYATNACGESWGTASNFTTTAGSSAGIWDGEGDPNGNWSLSLNWTDDLAPSNPTAGTLTFNNTGIAHSNTIVDTSRQVGGLTYANTVGVYTAALSGNSLTVTGMVAVGVNGTGSAAVSGAGSLAIGTATAAGSLQVGSGSSSGTGTLLLTNNTAVSIGTSGNRGDLRLGYTFTTDYLANNGLVRQAGGSFSAFLNSLILGKSDMFHSQGYGTLALSAVHGGTLDIKNSIVIGTAAGDTGGAASGTLSLGSNWTIRIGTSPSSRIGTFNVGVDNEIRANQSGSITAGAGGGSLTVYANSCLLGRGGWGSGSGVIDFSGITGPVVFDATTLTLGNKTASSQYPTDYGKLDLSGTTKLTFNVGSLTVGYNVDSGQYAGNAYGQLLLGAGTGTVGTASIGGYSSTSYLKTYGTRLTVTNTFTIGSCGLVESRIGRTASGLIIVNTNSSALSVASTIAAARGLKLLFTNNPAADGCTLNPNDADAVHWGLCWAGNHTNDLQSLTNASAKLDWDQSGLTGLYSNQVRIFYDAGMGTDRRPFDMTYVGFLLITTTSLSIGNGPAPSGDNLSASQAVVTATVRTNGGFEATGRVFYDTTDRGTNLTWRFTNEVGILQTGTSVTNTITGLTPNTTCYFMFYATNSGGQVAWGGLTGVQFKTPGEPFIGTLAATNVQGVSAWLNGILLTNGAAPATVRLYWGTSDAAGSIGAWQNTNEFAGPFSDGAGLTTNITGLTAGVRYYYRYYATNAFGEGWGATTNFVGYGPPSISSLPATNVMWQSAWLNGNLLSDGALSTTAMVFWGTSDLYPSLDGWLGSTNFGKVNAGGLTCRVMGLAAGQTYVFRYYATNTVGESWGDAVTFATRDEGSREGVHATGGIMIDSGNYQVHVFSNSDTFSVTHGGKVDVLVVGGGGGGGGRYSGGGGAGGLIYTTSYVVVEGDYAVTIGRGGQGSLNCWPGANGLPGADSSFGSFVATGGGYGGGGDSGYAGGAGGSGGGGVLGGPGGAGVDGQGYRGGNGPTACSGVGGGGAGGIGVDCTIYGRATDGGTGVMLDISGENAWYAGGGGGGLFYYGGSYGPPGNGGSGVGGTGGAGQAGSGTRATNGKDGTGSGGGGGGGQDYGQGGNGGSGIVIVRYPWEGSPDLIGTTMILR